MNGSWRCPSAWCQCRRRVASPEIHTGARSMRKVKGPNRACARLSDGEFTIFNGNVAEWLTRLTRNQLPSGAHVRIMSLSILFDLRIAGTSSRADLQSERLCTLGPADMPIDRGVASHAVASRAQRRSSICQMDRRDLLNGHPCISAPRDSVPEPRSLFKIEQTLVTTRHHSITTTLLLTPSLPSRSLLYPP